MGFQRHKISDTLLFGAVLSQFGLTRFFIDYLTLPFYLNPPPSPNGAEEPEHSLMAVLFPPSPRYFRKSP